MSDYDLGQLVRFSMPLIRRRVPTRKVEVQSTFGGSPYTYTRSINKEWFGNQFAAPAEGIVVGKRTLSNGHTQWEEYGNEYSPAEHFTAYLVVKDMHSKPVHVLPEHIEAISA